MIRIQHVILLALIACAFYGCGNPISTTGMTLAQAHQYLRSDGNWLCRMDYDDGTSTANFYSFAGYRGTSEAELLENCENEKLKTKKIPCKVVVKQGVTQCVRSASLGHFRAGKVEAPIVCRLSDEEGGLSGRGNSVEKAMKDLVEQCLNHADKLLCTDEIFDDQAHCKFQ